mgnify:CR=1 FL=1
MEKIGSYSIPIIVAMIIIFGFIKKVNVFDTFIEGAKEGMKSTVAIAPSIIGLITAVTMLKASGALDIFSAFIRPVTESLSIPSEIVPMMILRPISGSGSIALLDNMFKNFGPDSIIGQIASVMMGSSETTFYAITVYYGAIGVKNIRYTVPCALLADLTGFIMSILTVYLLMH